MRVLRYALGSTLGMTLLAGGYLWWVLLSPFGYDRPADVPPIQGGQHQVFVYGTLTHAPVRWLVYGRTGDPVTTTLTGFRKEALDLVKAQGQRVDGMLLTVNAQELAALDRYERLGYRYERVRLRLANGQQVWVYRRL